MKITRQFWGGLFIGLSLGLMIGASLVDGKLINKQHNWGFVVISMMLIWTGMVLIRKPSVGSQAE